MQPSLCFPLSNFSPSLLAKTWANRNGVKKKGGIYRDIDTPSLCRPNVTKGIARLFAWESWGQKRERTPVQMMKALESRRQNAMRLLGITKHDLRGEQTWLLHEMIGRLNRHPITWEKVHPLPRNHEVGTQQGTRHPTSSPQVPSWGHCSGLEIVGQIRANNKAQYEVGLTTIQVHIQATGPNRTL